MKRILSVALAAFLLVGLGCARQGVAVPAKNAAAVVVDTAALMQKSKPGQQATAYLQDVQKILQKGMDDVLKMYKGKENTQEGRTALAQAQAALNQQLIARQQAVDIEMSRAIREAVKNWQGKNSNIVLPAGALLGYGPANDVTNAVLTELNKISIKLPEKPQISVTPNKPAAKTPAKKK